MTQSVADFITAVTLLDDADEEAITLTAYRYIAEMTALTGIVPHHDGTPHWHMLLFMEPEHKQRVYDIMARYAHAEDAHEMNTPEARKARFHAEAIDPTKGSATGYIAKYISKNIDGYAMAR